MENTEILVATMLKDGQIIVITQGIIPQPEGTVNVIGKLNIDGTVDVRVLDGCLDKNGIFSDVTCGGVKVDSLSTA